MSFRFSDSNLKQIEALKKRYPSDQALSLPCLWMVQYQEGYISIEAIDAISEVTGAPAMEIYRVATFYAMFHLEPTARKRVLVCKTLSCKLCGSDEVLEQLQKYDIEVEHVECLGSCGTAPVMQIDDVNYENLTVEKIDTIVKGLI